MELVCFVSGAWHSIILLPWLSSPLQSCSAHPPILPLLSEPTPHSSLQAARGPHHPTLPLSKAHPASPLGATLPIATLPYLYPYPWLTLPLLAMLWPPTRPTEVSPGCATRHALVQFHQHGA